MVSSKERARFAAMFEKANTALQRQKKAISRLVAMNMEATAALLEIADMEEVMPDSNTTPLAYAQERARLALERIERMAAADGPEEGQSMSEEIPAISEEEGEASDEHRQG